ncbi:hypothetical protein [Halostella pelagica]|uniref:hypothetical protein n=1 Tax=Halostella pelagica TaxID=2583824 RepID=UPI00138733E0|nr:hypothetical protein [Halostella pelagica]
MEKVSGSVGALSLTTTVSANAQNGNEDIVEGHGKYLEIGVSFGRISRRCKNRKWR